MKAAIHTVYALALLAIAVVPATADVPLYSNGAVSGAIGGYTICCTYAVSDSFVLSSASTVTGVDFGAWTFYGDKVNSVQWSIGTTPGDSSLGSGTAAVSDNSLVKSYGAGGYDVNSDSFSTGPLSLGAGTYYLTLQNADTVTGTANGAYAFWDVNQGPSSAFQNGGSLTNSVFGQGSNSESFDIQGTSGTVTPEPGYWALLSVAIVGLIWVKRCRARVQA